MSTPMMKMLFIGGGYKLTNSVTLNGTTQLLSRTFGAPTSASNWTFSCWIKRGNTGAVFGQLFGTLTTLAQDFGFGALNGISTPANDTLNWTQGGGSALNTGATNTITDTTVWHHVLTNYNGTTCRIYQDGTEVTYASQNLTPTSLNANGSSTDIGECVNNTRFFNGKIADIYFIDGSVLTPSSFSFGTGSGTIHPNGYVGAYGTNGAHLKFDSSDGTDTSGNANNWTLTGAPTFTTDVPT